MGTGTWGVKVNMGVPGVSILILLNFNQYNYKLHSPMADYQTF